MATTTRPKDCDTCKRRKWTLTALLTTDNPSGQTPTLRHLCVGCAAGWDAQPWATLTDKQAR